MAVLIAILFVISSATAHMEMSWPYPLRSRHDPATPQSLIDYNMKAPLDASGSNFPCKGYQTNTPQNTVTTYDAGSSYNITLEGSASHGGGSCQLSLSYDNGKTFKVIKSMIGGCPLKATYDFTVPSSAPSGHALFAWTWSNFMGNREFYMNCASVQVVGAESHKRARDTAGSFDNLPNIWVADLASVNTCTTDGPNGSLNPVYPDPGQDVEYGGGMTSSSPATPGSCEVPAVARQALAPSFSYNPETSSTTLAASFTYNPESSTITSASSSGSTASASTILSTTPVDLVSTSASFTVSQSNLFGNEPSLPAIATLSGSTTTASSLSTTTMTMDCPATITVTLPPIQYPATYTISSPSSACTGTTANCPCNVGYSCLLINTCQWACIEMLETSSFSTSQRSSRQTGTVSQPASITTATSVVPSSNPAQPGFVDPSDLQAYLPCVPGTFICSDMSTWYTCDQQVDGSWSYQYPRQVATGMQCQPYLSPSGSAPGNGQQGNTPQGYYRNDQYVRAST